MSVLNNKEDLFPKVNHYKVDLEVKYLVRQNIFVISLITLIGILSIVYLLIIGAESRMVIGLSCGFILILLFNVASLSYGTTQIEFLKFNKFITSISFFTLMIVYVLYFRSPSFIPFLFLAYLIAAVYKDIKVLTVISLYFILTIVMLMINFGELFNFRFNPSTNDLVIGVFVFLFLTLLMISTYITIKESQFFYNQIAYSKEKEVRNLEMLIDLKSQVESEEFHYQEYFPKVKEMFEAFSKKLKISDVFKEKIDIIEKLTQKVDKLTILKEHEDFKIEDIHRLENLVLKKDALIRKIAMHIFYYNQKDIHEKEIFSETHFESFNKSNDSMDIKIVTFSIFYVLLKKGLPNTKPFTKEDIYHFFIETDFYYFLHPKIRLIYKENPEVFETIVRDVLDEVVS